LSTVSEFVDIAIQVKQLLLLYMPPIDTAAILFYLKKEVWGVSKREFSLSLVFRVDVANA